jgi:hypothetical protein
MPTIDLADARALAAAAITLPSKPEDAAPREVRLVPVIRIVAVEPALVAETEHGTRPMAWRASSLAEPDGTVLRDAWQAEDPLQAAEGLALALGEGEYQCELWASGVYVPNWNAWPHTWTLTVVRDAHGRLMALREWRGGAGGAR